MDPTGIINEAVGALCALLEPKSTASVAGWCQTLNLQQANDFRSSTQLHSPARQTSFLLGILLQSPEPPGEVQLTEAEWKRAQELLNEAFGAYQLLFYPDEGEELPKDKDWGRVRDVAMQAFMHYVGSDLLASAEQVEARIDAYLTPFDAEITARLGVSASDALRIARWISTHLQKSLELLNSARDAEKASRIRLIEKADAENWSMDRMRTEAEGAGHLGLVEELMMRMNHFGKVFVADLREQFGEAGEAFWNRYSVARGEGRHLDYPTEQTEYDLRPLIRLDGDSALCPSVNALFAAILTAGEVGLEASDLRERYYRSRDRVCEDEAADLFGRFFGAEAVLHRGLFDQRDSRGEHDLIILYQETCLIVEVKASPPIEPFRDPDRAFTRLRHAFHADSGIQGGFDQAEGIAARLRQGEVVELFDVRGQLVVRLDPAQFRAIYTGVFTRDDFGPLATNLFLLLEKGDSVPYPWVVNTFDLATICEAKDYWGWDPSILLEYLDERLVLHGKAFAIDELDLLAFRLRHGTFRSILDSKADLFVVDAHYADLFDEMYRARIVGDPKVVVTPKPPVLTDLRRSLQAGRLVVAGPEMSLLYPRNKPCPCGSGKKYKKCCGTAR